MTTDNALHYFINNFIELGENAFEVPQTFFFYKYVVLFDRNLDTIILC